MNINNKYTNEIALVEMKILIFESEYKKAINENIRKYFEDLIYKNKLYMKNLIYNSYELEINNIYSAIEILKDEDNKYCIEFYTIQKQIYSNKYNFNLCEKLNKDLNEIINKAYNNDVKINDYKNTINELKKEREEETTKSIHLRI